MKSISAKLLAWSVAALLLSLAAFILISRAVIGGAAIQIFGKINQLQLSQARAAYEAGGSKALGGYIAELKHFLGSEYILTDAAGVDLITGQHHPQMMNILLLKREAVGKLGDKGVLAMASQDGKYRWFVVTPPPFSGTMFIPFFLVVIAVVVILYWLMTTQIASPLRKLSGIVDRFGRGELGVRLLSTRSDEIGDLSRSVDRMADRIQTLLVAERQLLQDVSHELRSPLSRLTFAAEMIRKTEDRDASATRLRREIDRLSELVSTLLEMIKAEGDPGAVQVQKISLSDLVSVVGEDCEVDASARGCHLSTTTEPVQIAGNLELLRRAIENVVRNAIRYAPPSSAVELSLRKENDTAVITVRDHGPGIPTAYLSKIFDPFFRVDASRVESTGGIGLGLAISRRAVHFHHGDIAASNVDPGLIVRISLPIAGTAL